MKPFEPVPFRSLPQLPRRPHDYLTLPAKDVDVPVGAETVRIRYREIGEGPALTLVHGLMTSAYSFRYVATPLAEAGYRVLVPDLPGAGESGALRGPHSAPRLAEALAGFLDATDARGERVVGNSMGGYVAMRLALDDPDAMNRLVNVHSPVLPIPRLRALHLALTPGVARSVLGRVVSLSPERWVHRNVHYRDETLKSREEARIYAAPLKTESGRAAFASWLGDGLDPADLRRFVQDLEQTERFPVPLQLIYARTDPMVPPEMGHALERLVPDAEMVWLDESSHFAHVDTPGEFLDAALPFLEG
ncbi:MAG: alpha/beta hydrolase [Deltaproteobacteria bacterium]|nr:alpha/beta hydrolase [Deltaproteobacteria bacterium]